MIVVAAATALSAWIMRDVVNELLLTRDTGRIYFVAGLVALIFIVKGVRGFCSGAVSQPRRQCHCRRSAASAV